MDQAAWQRHIIDSVRPRSTKRRAVKPKVRRATESAGRAGRGQARIVSGAIRTDQHSANDLDRIKSFLIMWEWHPISEI